MFLKILNLYKFQMAIPWAYHNINSTFVRWCGMESYFLRSDPRVMFALVTFYLSFKSNPIIDGNISTIQLVNFIHKIPTLDISKIPLNVSLPGPSCSKAY